MEQALGHSVIFESEKNQTFIKSIHVCRKGRDLCWAQPTADRHMN